MADRFVVWLSAGALAVGMSAGTLAGAGLAVADDSATGDTGGKTSSESRTTDGKTGSDKPGADKPGADKPGADTDPDVRDDEDSDPDMRDEEEDTAPADADDELGADEADGDAPDKGNDDGPDSDRDKPRDREQAEKERVAGREKHTSDVSTVEVEDEPELETDPTTLDETDPAPLDETDPAPLDETESFGENVEWPVTIIETPLDRATTPEPEREATNVVETISAAVSSTVTTLLDPFATSDTPINPAAQPQMWTLMAAARREFETVLAPPPVTDTAVSLSATSQTLQVQAVANSLTYTAPPDLFDQLVVSGLRLARDIFGFFGLNFGGIVGSLLSSQDPPFFLTFGLTAQQTQYEISAGNVWKVWTFTPPDPTDKTVIGIHGGGFIIEPTIMHWIDYTQMARDTGATVVVPIYPLATTPAGAIVTVQPVMADFISQQIDRYGAENVSIHADSGGVTYALGAVRELILRGDPVPASMVLLGGQAYFSLDNPDIRLIDDPFFDVDHLEFYVDNSHAFDGVTGEKDPRISPLFMETAVLQALPPTTIYVGEVEFLLPDNLLLYQRAVEIGAPISMVVGTGLPHDWALGGLRTYSQTPVVRPDIYHQLGLTLYTGQPSAIHQVVAAGIGFINAVLSPFGGILAFTGLKVPILADGVPPFFVTYGLDVQRDTIAGMPVYILTPPTPTRATVVALHGGGYAAEASLFHYEMYADLARTTGATVIVPDYPLIGEPGGTSDVVVPQTAELLSEVIATSGAENTYVLGDSAGGGLGLAAVQLLVASGAATPRRIVLLAPALDLNLSDPASATIPDPLLNLATARRLGQLWAGDLGPTHPWASPINGSLDGLPPITVYSGSLDLLSPQALRLRERAIAEGADITFELRNGLMHDYPIFFFLPDALAERPSIYQALLGDNNATREETFAKVRAL